MGIVKTDPLVKQLLERLPPTVVFSGDQIEALKVAIADLNWKHHVVDIRLSTLGCYLILLGGIERRSQKRLTAERGVQPLLTPANLIVLVLLSILLSFAVVGVVCHKIDKLLMSV